MTQDFKVKDLKLAEFGNKEISLAETEMPGLMAIRSEYQSSKPLKGAKIIIADEGPGFNESNIGKVFERFYSNRPKEMFGLHSGLGLNIVKNIVESHKGHIKAYNLNEEGRRGAVVEIDLPIAD